MEQKERVIDLRNYFKYLWNNIIVVILVSVLAAVALVGYDYQKQKDEISGDTGASLSAIIRQNHDAYYKITGDNNSLGNYTDADTPEGAYNSEARIYIDFDYRDVEGIDGDNVYSMNQAFEEDARLILWSTESLEEVIDELNLHDYDDMKELSAADLKWMINNNFMGAHIMNVVVTDTDPERAVEIANAVIEKFIPRLYDEMHVNDARVIDEPTRPEESIQEASSISTRQLAKYGIAGFAGGLILIMIILLIVFLVKDAVWSRTDVEFADFIFLGDIGSKRNENLSISNIYQIIAHTCQNKKIIVAGADTSNGIDNYTRMFNSLAGENGVMFSASGDFKHNADLLRDINEDTSILVVARTGKTTVKKLADIQNTLHIMNAECLGVVLQ